MDNVPFALNDGEIFAEYCKKTLGLSEQNLHFVKDATLNDLKFNMKWLQNILKTYNGEASVIFIMLVMASLTNKTKQHLYYL